MSQPYEYLAQIYDQLMDHVVYDKWSDYIRSLFRYARHPVKTIIDLACGTGNHLQFLGHDEGYLIGSDNSISMLQVAAGKKSLTVPLVASDARQLSFSECSFDSVLLLYDTLNYFMDVNNIQMVFRETERVLKSGGLFIFDLVTEHHCRKYFKKVREGEFWEDRGYQRISTYDRNSSVQTTEFSIFIRHNLYHEIHRQKIYPLQTITQLLNQSGLIAVGVFNGFSFEEVSAKSERIHVVARKN